MKRNRELLESYRRLFYFTGQPVFFMMYKTIAKTNTPILLPPMNEQTEESLSL